MVFSLPAIQRDYTDEMKLAASNDIIEPCFFTVHFHSISIW